jgi:hypothetical protein
MMFTKKNHNMPVNENLCTHRQDKYGLVFVEGNEHKNIKMTKHNTEL